MEKELLTIVNKPFRFAKQHAVDTCLFRVTNSGSVFWLQEQNKPGQEWSYHCGLLVMESYIAAHSRHLWNFYEERLTMEDFGVVSE